MFYVYHDREIENFQNEKFYRIKIESSLFVSYAVHFREFFKFWASVSIFVMISIKGQAKLTLYDPELFRSLGIEIRP